MTQGGRQFYKMSGSGNDFVVFDARREPPGVLEEPSTIRALCARGSGVGADGVVFVEPARGTADFRMRYFNSDGSLASLCGNASLCVARLAVELGAARPEMLRFESDAGVIEGRLRDGLPEIDLQPVTEVRPAAPVAAAAGEERIGFAVAGVPHLTVRCADVSLVDVAGRGAALRRDPSLGEPGANVNFVSADESGGWAIRTFERGVEGETLACGTGAVATAILLTEWAQARGEVALRTRSGRVLTVRLRREGAAWIPSLRGEGRIVYVGRLAELPSD